jgi:hypothetical protein
LSRRDAGLIIVIRWVRCRDHVAPRYPLTVSVSVMGVPARLACLGFTVLVLLAGCGGSDKAVTDDLADVYIAVLRRYLGPSGDKPSEFSPYKIVHVLDRTNAVAEGGRILGPEQPIPFSADVQQRITAALSDDLTVRFVANPDDLMYVVDGPAGVSPHPLACMKVRDDGMLVSMTAPVGDADEVRVGVSGRLSCVEATYVTYKVERSDGGWRVSGIDGGVGIA